MDDLKLASLHQYDLITRCAEEENARQEQLYALCCGIESCNALKKMVSLELKY